MEKVRGSQGVTPERSHDEGRGAAIVMRTSDATLYAMAHHGTGAFTDQVAAAARYTWSGARAARTRLVSGWSEASRARVTVEPHPLQTVSEAG